MNIAQLKLDLTRDEGVRLKPYEDSVGKLTIGIGRNLDDVGISSAEADYMLTNDVASIMQTLDMAIPYWKNQTEDRQRAIANMAFNMGIHRLLGFTNMLAAIRAGDFATASQEALNSEWAKQVGARAQRIAVLLATG